MVSSGHKQGKSLKSWIPSDHTRREQRGGRETVSPGLGSGLFGGEFVVRDSVNGCVSQRDPRGVGAR